MFVAGGGRGTGNLGKFMQVWLEVTHKKANVRRVVLRTDALIGRSSDCNLRVGSVGVSRQHCRILLRESRVFVRDLKSANGTFIDGKRIPPEKDIMLQSGDRLSIGPVEFVVRTEAKQAAKPDKPDKPDKPQSAEQKPVTETPAKELTEPAEIDDTLQETVTEQDMLLPDRPAEAEVEETLPEFELTADDLDEQEPAAADAAADNEDESLLPGSDDDESGEVDDDDIALELLEGFDDENEDEALPVAEPVSDEDSALVAEPEDSALLAEPIEPENAEEEMDDDTRAFLALMDSGDDDPPAEKPAAQAKPQTDAEDGGEEKEETLAEFLKQLEED